MVKVLFHGAAAVAVTLLLAQNVLGYWRISCSVIQLGRIDPVISFGKVSQHVHKVSGSSAISVNSDYDSLTAAPCTSCEVQADKSGYWTPQLYYLHANGEYEEVPNDGMAVYYLGRGVDAWGGNLSIAFPPGLKFLSGNSNARSYNRTDLTYGNATYPNTPKSNRVSFSCINYANPVPETYYMADTNCPDGLRAQVHLQSCWDGQNLYLPDQSHVDYLSQIDNGVCPPTHPILLPHIFFEVLYSVANINQDGGMFVFSNGDETGYGFHGDFINGWDIPTLTPAIAKCLVGNPDGAIDNCPPLKASLNYNFASLCPETSPVFPCEPVHGIIQSLPGCITPTGFNVDVVSADNTCPGGNRAACAPNFNNGPPTPYPGDAKYNYLGCYTEATGRALSQSRESNSNMTAEACIAFCAGSTYVGVEYGSECYCGNTLNPGSVSAPSTNCDMTCSGNRWELCGGPDRLNLYRHS